jgi:hypothetical protein
MSYLSDMSDAEWDVISAERIGTTSLVSSQRIGATFLVDSWLKCAGSWTPLGGDLRPVGVSRRLSGLKFRSEKEAKALSDDFNFVKLQAHRPRGHTPGLLARLASELSVCQRLGSPGRLPVDERRGRWEAAGGEVRSRVSRLELLRRFPVLPRNEE